MLDWTHSSHLNYNFRQKFNRTPSNKSRARVLRFIVVIFQLLRNIWRRGFGIKYSALPTIIKFMTIIWETTTPKKQKQKQPQQQCQRKKGQKKNESREIAWLMEYVLFEWLFKWFSIRLRLCHMRTNASRAKYKSQKAKELSNIQQRISRVTKQKGRDRGRKRWTN